MTPRLLVGLTGGIASGKSTVAARLAEHGALIIDADILAREVVAPGTPGLAAIVARFGAQILDGDRLDRRALGAVVFTDPAARADLEAIVHPAVRARAAELTAAAPAGAIVVQVIPLLVEAGQVDRFDIVVVVDADPADQLARIRHRDGLDEAAARARIAAQASREQRLAIADHVLVSGGSLAELMAATDRLWQNLETAAAARR